MAFADPQSITISGTAISLPRVSQGDNTGGFLSSDGNVKLTVAHSYGARIQRALILDHRKVAADPLNAAQNLNYSMRITNKVDVPRVGYTPADVKAIWDGLLAQLNASSGADLVKFFGGES